MSAAKGAWLRVVPMAIWCLMVISGVAILVFSPGNEGKVDFEAARDLPQNTLLRADVLRPRSRGRYIVATTGVKAGASIMPEDLAGLPVPPGAPPARLLMVIPVPDASTSDNINADTQVQLCGIAPPALATVTVKFIHCVNETSSSKCSVTVEIPNEAAPTIVASGFKDQSSINALHVAKFCH